MAFSEWVCSFVPVSSVHFTVMLEVVLEEEYPLGKHSASEAQSQPRGLLYLMAPRESLPAKSVFPSMLTSSPTRTGPAWQCEISHHKGASLAHWEVGAASTQPLCSASVAAQLCKLPLGQLGRGIPSGWCLLCFPRS